MESGDCDVTVVVPHPGANENRTCVVAGASHTVIFDMRVLNWTVGYYLHILTLRKCPQSLGMFRKHSKHALYNLIM